MNEAQKLVILREIQNSEDEIHRWKYAMDTWKRNGGDVKSYESRIAYHENHIKSLKEGL